jgi:hypothetical protein
MEPWYKVATPRREVHEGGSFNSDEFAIALESRTRVGRQSATRFLERVRHMKPPECGMSTFCVREGEAR